MGGPKVPTTEHCEFTVDVTVDAPIAKAYTHIVLIGLVCGTFFIKQELRADSDQLSPNRDMPIFASDP